MAVPGKVKYSVITLPNGEDIFYREYGEGQFTMLLLHGNLASSRFFEPFFPWVENCRIIAPDMRGYGNSSYKNKFSSLFELAQDFAMFCATMKLEKICVAGWSTGGGVALELAALCPDLVKSIILINGISCKGFPVPPKDEMGRPISGAFYKNKKEMIKDTLQVGLIRNAIAEKNRGLLRNIWEKRIYVNQKPGEQEFEALLDEMLKQRCNDDAYWALASFNMTDKFSGVNSGNRHIFKVAQPVLAFHGDKDYVCEPCQARDNKEYLSEQMELVFLEDCGHTAFTDYPQLLGKRIFDFLNDLNR